MPTEQYVKKVTNDVEIGHGEVPSSLGLDSTVRHHDIYRSIQAWKIND